MELGGKDYAQAETELRDKLHEAGVASPKAQDIILERIAAAAVHAAAAATRKPN